jgi:hypothetical protein
MSIGNLQDYGNKGNNFPWQLKMLQGIDALLSAFTTSTTSFLAPQARVTNIVRSSTTGTITAGKYSASFANVSASANATVKGVILKPGETINFDAGTLNNKLDAIAYDGTLSELLIIYIS